MSEPILGVCTLVLAAGQGSRYRERSGEDKLLVPARDAPAAPTVLAGTLASLAGITERLVVVTREDNLALRAWLDQEAGRFGAEVLSVRTNGLGHSLAQAVAHYPAERGWLVALGDMPYLRPETIRRIASEIQQEHLVVPSYGGQRGNPRGIGSGYRTQLIALNGERGAQALFAAGSVTDVDVDDPGALEDIDRPEDRRPV
ncbi:nucleotidyltransferase family protein [Stutzerimonas zhaodongensis]|uniref:nucleotidyltransferase family protein n=1 Tax=Stutzerimonas zhaodongensis TaxID=1176257 RepID=UPI0021063472|nr:nucleotidyltransferase family protein [Stutzerimonas zhaodongensis]MCQ2030949.1 nucleotidyltransferase family protein [Stutzerimonas zhaodongensis]